MVEKSLSVAVVDDDPSVRRALQRVLNVLGIRAEGFVSGETFLASLRHEVPDCVVLDLHMPGLSGLDVQQQIGRLGERLPVVIITGHHEPGMRSRCLSAGAADYLRKPIDAQALQDAIARAVAGGRT
jgi:FixJ family two-component response regulator